MESPFPGMAPQAAPAAPDPAPAPAAEPAAGTDSPFPGVAAAAAPEPAPAPAPAQPEGLDAVLAELQSLRSEIAAIKANPAVAQLIETAETGIDAMSQPRTFEGHVRAALAAFEDDFRALIRDEVSKGA